MLNGIENVMSNIYIPALKKSANGWGALENGNTSVRHDFMNKLEGFVSILVSEYPDLMFACSS